VKVAYGNGKNTKIAAIREVKSMQFLEAANRIGKSFDGG
jgi:hypothetical protein